MITYGLTYKDAFMDNLVENNIPKSNEAQQNLDRFEAIRDFCLPVVMLGLQIPQDTVNAVQHAALVTLHTLGVPMDKFKISDAAQLVNVEKKNEQNLYSH